MRRNLRIGPSVALMLVSVLLAGCGVQSVPKNAIPGTYEITYEPHSGTVLGVERLVIKADGTFEQTFTPTGSKAWTNTGRWTVDTSKGQTIIHLCDYMEALDEWDSQVRPHPKRTDLHTSVSYSYGTINITTNDDLGYHLRKVK